MSFDKDQFRHYIIAPALMSMGMHSQSAVNLLLGTMAQESHFGKYVHQLGNGPAKGVYQMEPATHDDIRDNYIKYRQSIRTLLANTFAYKTLDASRLIYDLRYATIMARLHYYRVSEPLPAADNIAGLAAYWKEHYNTRFGRGTEDEFITNYKHFVRG